MSVQIQDAQRKMINVGIFATDMREARTATVRMEEGGCIMVSRFDNEQEWLADAAFASNGFPLFSHGEGTRYCSKQAVADPQIVAALDAADYENA